MVINVSSPLKTIGGKMLSFNNEPVILDLRRESINEWRPKNVMKNVKITTPPNTFFIPRDRKGTYARPF